MSDLVPLNLKELVSDPTKSMELSHLLDVLQKRQEDTSKVPVRETKQARVDKWKASKDTMDLDQVQAMQTTMANYVDNHFLDRVQMEEPRVLSQDEVDALAAEYADITRIKDMLDARLQETRAMIFASLDESFSAERSESVNHDATPVSQVPGRLISDKQGLKFCREGGKRKSPTVDWKRVEKALEPEKFQKICKSEVVPEHVKYTPDDEALMDAVISGDIPLDVVREALIPGSWTTPRFAVRKA